LLEQGLHVGYRHRATCGTWIARRATATPPKNEEKLGLADGL
jgi:integrase